MVAAKHQQPIGQRAVDGRHMSTILFINANGGNATGGNRALPGNSISDFYFPWVGSAKRTRINGR